jgi:DNA-binding response OmpR family regulator
VNRDAPAIAAAAIEEHPLTPRQVLMLEHVFVGKSNKEIAQACGVSPLTVKNHLLHIFSKLNARNRAEAVHAALARGVLKVPSHVLPAALPQPPAITDWVQAGNLRLSFSRRCAEVDGKPLQLRRRILLLLAALAAHPGMVYSRQQLLDYVVGAAHSIEERSIDVWVRELRKALRAAGCTCTVRTEREHGYGLVVSASSEG